jgi:hypothetical protein
MRLKRILIIICLALFLGLWLFLMLRYIFRG